MWYFLPLVRQNGLALALVVVKKIELWFVSAGLLVMLLSASSIFAGILKLQCPLHLQKNII